MKKQGSTLITNPKQWNLTAPGASFTKIIPDLHHWEGPDLALQDSKDLVRPQLLVRGGKLTAVPEGPLDRGDIALPGVSNPVFLGPSHPNMIFNCAIR